MRAVCPQLHKVAVSEAEAGPGEQWGRKTEASVIVGVVRQQHGIAHL